jgi:hypothetical protein
MKGLASSTGKCELHEPDAACSTQRFGPQSATCATQCLPFASTKSLAPHPKRALSATYAHVPSALPPQAIACVSAPPPKVVTMYFPSPGTSENVSAEQVPEATQVQPPTVSGAELADTLSSSGSPAQATPSPTVSITQALRRTPAQSLPRVIRPSQ